MTEGCFLNIIGIELSLGSLPAHPWALPSIELQTRTMEHILGRRQGLGSLPAGLWESRQVYVCVCVVRILCFLARPHGELGQLVVSSTAPNRPAPEMSSVTVFLTLPGPASLAAR